MQAIKTLTVKAKQSLTENDFKTAIQHYTTILVQLGLENDPVLALQATTSTTVPLPLPPPILSATKIAQVYLGKSAAWFGAEQYWKSYEDATKALTLDPANRWAVLRSGYCLLRMSFFQAAVDVFRRGLILHTGDKKLTEGFQKGLDGLRMSWHKYLPNIDGIHIGPTSTATLSSTLAMPQDVAPPAKSTEVDPNSASSTGTTEEIAEAAEAAAAAADKELEKCEQRYVAQLKQKGLLLDIEDLVHGEAQWWSTQGSEWRDQMAASRDTEQSTAKLTKVLLRYKVSLTALYVFYLTNTTNTTDLTDLTDTTRLTHQHQPTPPLAPASSMLPVSPRKTKQRVDAATRLVPLPLQISHGLSQEMTIDHMMRFVCECKLIGPAPEDVDVVHRILAKFQRDTDAVDSAEVIRKRQALLTQEAREGSIQRELHTKEDNYANVEENTSVMTEALVQEATVETATGGSGSEKEQQQSRPPVLPTTILFPKFCELVVRLVLKKYPPGARELTPVVIDARKKDLLGLSLIDKKKKELEHAKSDKPANMNERLSRGLDVMLSVIGQRLIGTSMTNYRWIPLKDRTYVQTLLKPLLPELRGIYLHLRRTSRCINNIGLVDFLKFLVQMDFVDTTLFQIKDAARCYVSVTYFVGNVHLDLIDCDAFVEVLVCCADVLSNNGGMVPMQKRVFSVLQKLVSNYERKCLT